MCVCVCGVNLNQMVVDHCRYNTVDPVSMCEYIFRVSYLSGDSYNSDCMDTSIIDLQFDEAAETLLGIVKTFATGACSHKVIPT